MQFAVSSTKLCRFSRWLGTTVLVAAYNEQFLLTIDRYAAMRNFAWYRDHVMYKLRQPIIATMINYTVTAVAYSPVWFFVVHNDQIDRCEISGSIPKGFMILFVVYAVVFSVIPMILVLSLSVYVWIKLR